MGAPAGWGYDPAAYRDPADARAYVARRFRGPLKRLRHRTLVRALGRALDGVDGARTVLDVPTGTGRLLPALLARGLRPVGADLSRAMIGAYDGPRGPAFVVADAARLPFRDGAFDLVVSVRFLAYVPPDARRAALREMARVSGRWVLGEYARCAWTLRQRMRRPGARPAFTRDDLARDAEAAGLRIANVVLEQRLFSNKALVAFRRA